MGCTVAKSVLDTGVELDGKERKLSDASTTASLSGAVAELLGPTLLTQQGPKRTEEVVAGKTIGLYFSAHWCPPCRSFTPQLAKAYTKHLRSKGLEIIFVSSDQDEQQFQSYFKSMPWAALPFSDRERKAELSKRFKVQGIPTLVLLDADGKVLSLEGRAKVSQDPSGKDFPWTPAPLEELLDTPLLSKAGKVGAASLEGKVVGLYFSAHWCPPCQMFTPQLAAQYKKIQEAGLPFEIVFVSSDKGEKEFKSYFAEMPWLALPFADRKRKEALSSHFGVSGIPSLVLLDTDRSVITKNGRSAVFRDLSEFPWPPKPVKDLNEDAQDLSSATAVVVLADEAGAAEASAAMAPLAEEYLHQAKAAGADPEVLFYVSTASTGPTQRVRQLCKLEPGTAPQLLLLDIPDNGGYYLPEAPLTTDGLRAMLKDLKTGKLQRKQLG